MDKGKKLTYAVSNTYDAVTAEYKAPASVIAKRKWFKAWYGYVVTAYGLEVSF